MSNSGEAHIGAMEKSLGMVSGVVVLGLELCRTRAVGGGAGG